VPLDKKNGMAKDRSMVDHDTMINVPLHSLFGVFPFILVMVVVPTAPTLQASVPSTGRINRWHKHFKRVETRKWLDILHLIFGT
jgi:hypothetical protein